MKKELSSYVETQAERAENLSFCSGIKLLHIRNSVEELLNAIGRNGFFEEYTVHSISHIDEMLKIIEWLIPSATKEKMTSAEWLMLTLAVYFHDLGMVVTKDEYNSRDKTSFNEYKAGIFENDTTTEYTEYAGSKDDKFLYQEFVRENHAKRIRMWLDGAESIHLGDAKAVREEVDSTLANLDKMFRTDLGLVCESHHLDDLDDFSKYRVNASYGNDDNEKVNIDYIAIILRIADLLHITRDRTPSISRRIINITNPFSVIEWEKQQAVRAVKPKVQRNAEGIVDETLEKNTIEVTAYFDGAETAEAYFGLSAYLQYTKKELERCNDIVLKAQKFEGTVDYKFPWTNIDESQITAVGFEPKKLQFTIAQDNILQLLVGHTLYNDSSVVVRELVQNGIDAVKLQKLIDGQKRGQITEGKIYVTWNDDKRELSFWDNGTGMTVSDVENYLLKVGASKYKDASIKKKFPDFNSISHFGIGILTCFMIANDIDIITSSEEQDQASIINLRKVNGSYLLRKVCKNELDERIQKHGTLVKLHVRNDVDMTCLETDLRKWIVLPEIPVYLKRNDESAIRIGYDSLSDVLTKYLEETGRSVDKKKYDVYERTHGNVTIAFAVRHLQYLSDWCLMGIEQRRKGLLPIGTCVEGIRVEFTTPGYKDLSILAIANIKNSKYQTNVARSAIELDANKEIVADIYHIFAEYVQEQMNQLEGKNYSNSWALSEGYYLMSPLLSFPPHNRNAEPVDEEILTQCLATLKCIVLENNGTREIISAMDVSQKEEVNIFECKMAKAAEYLLREIRCDTTSEKLIGLVCPDDNFMESATNVICNYNEMNILHQFALRNMDVTEITVNRKYRRIHLKYRAQAKIWDRFDLRLGGARTLFIPKETFLIEGLDDEIGIRTSTGIYLRSDSTICEYIRKITDSFLAENSEESATILNVFLSCVFDNRIMEQVSPGTTRPDSMFKQVLEERFMRVGDDLLTKMWAKIDPEEFTGKILTANYSLYSIDNWSRKGEPM